MVLLKTVGMTGESIAVALGLHYGEQIFDFTNRGLYGVRVAMLL